MQYPRFPGYTCPRGTVSVVFTELPPYACAHECTRVPGQHAYPGTGYPHRNSYVQPPYGLSGIPAILDLDTTRVPGNPVPRYVHKIIQDKIA
eukprot:1876259-Rhodomonas_salina.1